jgi:hypothetical protein
MGKSKHPTPSSSPFDPSSLPPVPGLTLPALAAQPYAPTAALKDLPGVRYALSLFLNSHMVECEDWCNANDPKRERLYWSSGIGLIECVRGVMSFEEAVCPLSLVLAPI